MPYLEFLALLLADDDFGRQLAELGDEIVHENHSDVLVGYCNTPVLLSANHELRIAN